MICANQFVQKTIIGGTILILQEYSRRSDDSESWRDFRMGHLVDDIKAVHAYDWSG